MNVTNPYIVLGIPHGSSAEDAKKAYRKLAKQYHPDKNQGDKGAEDKFKEIAIAYDQISNGTEAAGRTHFYGRYNMSDVFKNENFGFGFGMQTEYMKSTLNINMNISIDFVKALNGIEKIINAKHINEKIKVKINLRKKCYHITTDPTNNKDKIITLKLSNRGNIQTDPLSGRTMAGDIILKAKFTLPKDIDILPNGNITHNINIALYEFLINQEATLESIDKRKFIVKLDKFKTINNIFLPIPDAGLAIPPMYSKQETCAKYVFYINVITPDMSGITDIHKKLLTEILKP